MEHTRIPPSLFARFSPPKTFFSSFPILLIICCLVHNMLAQSTQISLCPRLIALPTFVHKTINENIYTEREGRDDEAYRQRNFLPQGEITVNILQLVSRTNNYLYFSQTELCIRPTNYLHKLFVQ